MTESKISLFDKEPEALIVGLANAALAYGKTTSKAHATKGLDRWMEMRAYEAAILARMKGVHIPFKEGQRVRTRSETPPVPHLTEEGHNIATGATIPVGTECVVKWIHIGPNGVWALEVEGKGPYHRGLYPVVEFEAIW